MAPGDTEHDLNILVSALSELAEEQKHNNRSLSVPLIVLPDMPQLAMSPREAYYAKTELIPFSESAGRIIAEFVMVYRLESRFCSR